MATPSSSADLKWKKIDETEKYKLRYKVAKTADWITLYPVSHHKIITGLSQILPTNGK